MGMQTEIQQVLVWDKTRNEMVVKTEVVKKVVGTKGSVFIEAGPLYVDNNEEEIKEAKETLDLHILSILRQV